MNDYIARQIAEYVLREAEERRLEEEIGNDTSVENIRRVIEARIYTKKGRELVNGDVK